MRFTHTCFILFLSCIFWKGDCLFGERENSEIIVENITDCRDPEPPFPKIPLLIVDHKVYQRKGKQYISGHTTVLQEVLFKNFSVRTYDVDDHGRLELKFTLGKQNCRHLYGQVFLVFAGIKANKKNCQLIKGTSTFIDVDLNKIEKSFPAWHSTGKLLHRAQLVDRGFTVLCLDVLFTEKEIAV